MSDQQNSIFARAQSYETAAQRDEGLRSYMLRIYNMMALGVALTGVVALFMSVNPQLMNIMMGSPLKWVVFLGVLGLGFIAPKIIMTGSKTAVHTCFWLYATLWGVMISPMILSFLNIPGGAADIARAFLITSSMFAGASIVGYTTKRDLSTMGRFFVMAAIGLLVAMIANMFIGSTGFSLLISVVTVLLFAGITAYETQMIKELYFSATGSTQVQRMAIFGAFMLYGSFVTMFIHILNIIGIMRGQE